MMRRVLVANRGEIARRIIRTCRQMGVSTVAIFSDADAQALHVSEADEAVPVGPAAAAQSYLNIPRIIEAARRTSADAVHPGYGFLSENADFVEACEAAGLTFVGPPAAVLRHMGSKPGARDAAARAGVPVVPGVTPRSQRTGDIAAAIHAAGLPAVVKAAAGGGGKGMRIVRAGDELPAAIDAARGEARRAFGDDTLYVERLIDHPRHVEVQLLADRHGSVVHLFERDCTLQRRHQKVIEEAPGARVTPALGARLTDAAIRIAKSVGYVNAGTVEFLVSGDGDAADVYFLEVNARLQVEHPVTEAVTGIDLVELQLRIAAGEPLPFRQPDITCSGHAIECRVYAEDPRRLLPQTGRLLRYREPAGQGIRVDSAAVEGQSITVHYDPLLAKLTVHASSRSDALDLARGALAQFEILGIRHNLAFLAALVRRPEVAAHDIHTRFIEEHLGELVRPAPLEVRRSAAAIAATLAAREPAAMPIETGALLDPWQTLGPITW